jgi:hypothetical protein
MLGVLLPAVLTGLAMYAGGDVLKACMTGAAGAAAIAGLFFYKYAYVRAAQLPPLS